MNLKDIQAISKPTKFLNAVEMGSQTCVGFINRDFPMPRGNCFNIGVKSGKKIAFYKVLNFNAENMTELFKRNKISWPIKIIDAGDGCCFIHDDRIPGNWYQEHICRSCAPYRLQSVQGQLERWRDLESGRRVEKNGMISIKIEAEKRTLKCKWSAEAKEDLNLSNIKGKSKTNPGVIYAPYKPGSKILVPKKTKD